MGKKISYFYYFSVMTHRRAVSSGTNFLSNLIASPFPAPKSANTPRNESMYLFDFIGSNSKGKLLLIQLIDSMQCFLLKVVLRFVTNILLGGIIHLCQCFLHFWQKRDIKFSEKSFFLNKMDLNEHFGMKSSKKV